MDQKPEITLENLYPNLTEEQLAEAKENLRQYLLLAWEIAGLDSDQKNWHIGGKNTPSGDKENPSDQD